MSRQQRRFEERMKKKQNNNTNKGDKMSMEELEKKYNWIFTTPPVNNSSFNYENPIIFFENLSDDNGVLSDKKKTEFKEFLKELSLFKHHYVFGGTLTGIKKLIGWNKEKNGWFYFRPPFEDNPFPNMVFLGNDGIEQNMEKPQWVDGDGISTWCIPPKYILKEYGIKKVA